MTKVLFASSEGFIFIVFENMSDSCITFVAIEHTVSPFLVKIRHCII